MEDALQKASLFGLNKENWLFEEYKFKLAALGLDEEWLEIIFHCILHKFARDVATFESVFFCAKSLILEGQPYREVAKYLLVSSSQFVHEDEYYEYERQKFMRQITECDIKDEKHMWIFFRVFGE